MRRKTLFLAIVSILLILSSLYLYQMNKNTFRIQENITAGETVSQIYVSSDIKSAIRYVEIAQETLQKLVRERNLSKEVEKNINREITRLNIALKIFTKQFSESSEKGIWKFLPKFLKNPDFGHKFLSILSMIAGILAGTFAVLSYLYRRRL